MQHVEYQLSPLRLNYQLSPLWLSYGLSGSTTSIARSPLGLSYRLSGSAKASQAHQLSPLGLSSYHLSGSAAIASRAQQLSPLGLCYRLSGSAAIASRAQKLSGSAAIASWAQQLSPLGLISYRLIASRALQAQRVVGMRASRRATTVELALASLSWSGAQERAESWQAPTLPPLALQMCIGKVSVPLTALVRRRRPVAALREASRPTV